MMRARSVVLSLSGQTFRLHQEGDLCRLLYSDGFALLAASDVAAESRAADDADDADFIIENVALFDNQVDDVWQLLGEPGVEVVFL